jgi:predicted RecB family nuclease
MKIVAGDVRFSASDLANFLACRHLTRLDLLTARGELAPPYEFDIGFQTLIERGERHERSVLEQFQADGLTVVDIGGDVNAGQAVATGDALRRGVDVIYQGTLLREASGTNAALLGRPDFLVRADLLRAPDNEPRPKGLHYEVVDAKLARSAKARAVLQITFYTSLLSDLQGVVPRWMHLALGNSEFASLKVDNFAAYERQTRRSLREFVEKDPGDNPPMDPYPDPVEHCAICRWSQTCAARRRADDDLSLVAGITSRQRRALKTAGVLTRRGFAGLAEAPTLFHLRREALERTQLQARLQVVSEDEGRLRYELLDPERDDNGALIPNRGLLALPQPSVGDLFFDIEGARYYTEDGKEFGLQYLFGLVDTADVGPDGTPRYTQIWSFDRQREKRGFEELIDFITERRRRNPELHVYHYNHYEPTSIDHLTELHETREEAVGRLMGRFSTREDELDDLFRFGVFVDLYRVVRQGLRVGVESYSIKRLEPLCGYSRRIDLGEATRHLIAFEAALDEGMAEAERRSQQVVAGYNEDDCRATLALRDWLESKRLELAERLREEPPRPKIEEEAHATEDPEVTRIRSALVANLPLDALQRTAEESAKALTADLLDWHRREAKPAWWRYFHLKSLSNIDLIGEPDALGGLKGGDKVADVKRSVVRQFSFPPQEHGFGDGDRAVDPLTGKEWTVWSVDDEHQQIELKIGRDYAGSLPMSLVEGGPPGTTHLKERLRDLGDRVVREGVQGRDPATALLLRTRPRGDQLQSGPLRRDDETATDAAIRLALRLTHSYLPIQGPPGTGKTYTGAEQILDLIAGGRAVGVTGSSHAVIHNLITEVLKHAARRGSNPRIGQRADEDNPFLHHGAAGMTYDRLEHALRSRELDVGAGTIWMWARESFQKSVDTLFVDEAGQMSLANVLAVTGAGKNLILLGDPQQLAQPSQAAHPPGAGVSALEHILDGRATMPVDAGLLIDRTRRMHPNLCRYTSDVFYDGKLGWVDGLERQALLPRGAFGGAGLRVVEVPHEGNTNESLEEAAEVARIVNTLLGQEWTDEHGDRRLLTPAEILVVTPYNAQIREIEGALAKGRCTGVQVGTVDKFQGREAPVALYSLATSSAEDAPRGMEFPYDLHRLNVATSRARAMVIVVASPDLVRVLCRTPRQMALANALCRLWEST